MARPNLSAVPVFFHNYINQVTGEDIMDAFERETKIMSTFWSSIPEDRYDYRYGPGKWSVREVVQHIIDAERIFSYRALRFSRKDATPLASFDENLYVTNSQAASRAWSDLIDEYNVVRQSSILLFRSLDAGQLESVGISNNHSISVLALGFIIVGHPLHHKNIIEARYL